MVAMAREEDRAKIKLGPARFDTPKAIRDRIAETIQETPATALVGGVTIDDVQDAIDNYVPVTGGVGQVIGIPPGTPFVYVPANLAANPADLIALGFVQYELLFPAAPGGSREVYKFSQDASNILGLGAQTVMNDDGTTLYAYNPTAGTSTALAHPSVGNVNKPITANNRIVVGKNRVTTSSTSEVTQVYDGTTWASATFTMPSGTYFWGMGPCTDPSRVCVVGAGTTTFITSILVAEYAATGGSALTSNTFTVPNTPQANFRTKVENGWAIAFDSPTGADPNVFVGPANATSTNVWRQLSFPGARHFGANGVTVGSSGIGFAAYVDNGGNLEFAKFDANTGSVTVFASALNGVITERSGGYGTSTTRRVASYGLAYANDNNFALGGALEGPANTYTPAYLMIDTTGGNVSISATYFTAFAEITTSGSFHSVLDPLRLSNGDITFVMRDAGGTPPNNAFLYQVAGP
jgi:hypothetical protein